MKLAITLILLSAALSAACSRGANAPVVQNQNNDGGKRIIGTGPVKWHVAAWTGPGEIPGTRASVEFKNRITPLGLPTAGKFIEYPGENWEAFNIPATTISAISAYYAGSGTIFYAEKSGRGTVVIKAVYHDEKLTVPARARHKTMVELK